MYDERWLEEKILMQAQEMQENVKDLSEKRAQQDIVAEQLSTRVYVQGLEIEDLKNKLNGKVDNTFYFFCHFLTLIAIVLWTTLI